MDTVSKKRRSWIMSRIRSSDTAPELAYARHLRLAGIPHVTHPGLTGRPDFLIPPAGIVVFVDGCF
jgi:DNA mismatch endonuclease (patch repair protein)